MNTDNADLSHSSLRESVFLPMKMNGMERLKILFVLYNDEQWYNEYTKHVIIQPMTYCLCI